MFGRYSGIRLTTVKKILQRRVGPVQKISCRLGCPISLVCVRPLRGISVTLWSSVGVPKKLRAGLLVQPGQSCGLLGCTSTVIVMIDPPARLIPAIVRINLFVILIIFL